ncbi:uncharacterized protein C6orf47 homolog [Hemiscyllium ocellatum]|uniref:uncharacterized protein C6orf47 homolog n=1 Tax=Hemiscyllium ocellatum TaxID=170820 RepID=UPI002965EFA9|nr:uncharacterized protein C6orf47 homolog [Hemiscyllium ocellatum]
MGTRAEPSGSQEPAGGTPTPSPSPVTTERGRRGWRRRLLLLLLGLPPRLAALLLGCVRRLGSWRLPPPWPWKRKARERRVEPEPEGEKTGREPPGGLQEGGGGGRGVQVVNPAATPEPEPLDIGFNLVRHLFDAAVVSLLLLASPLARAALDALGLRGLLRLWLHGLALFLAAWCGLALAAWLLRAYLAQLCLLFGAVQLLVLGVSLRRQQHRQPGPGDGGLEEEEEGHLAGLHSLASGISWERDNGLEDHRWEEDDGLEDHNRLEDHRWEEDDGLEDHRLERDNGLEDHRLERRPLEERGLERRPLEERGLEDRLVQYVEAVGRTTTTRGP